jgi:hypothetical protein
VRLFAQTEIGQQRAGQDTAQWQGSLGGYLLQIAAAGQHPHLAAALADHPEGAADRPAGPAGQAGDGGSAGPEPLFDRAMTRILTGLLPPSPVPPAGP